MSSRDMNSPDGHCDRLAEAIDEPITRQRMLKRSMAAGAGLLVGSTLSPAALAREASASAKDPVTIVFASYGGIYSESQQKAWFDPFMKANPHIKIKVTGPVDYGKLQAMVEAKRVTWDIVDVNGDFGGVQQSHLLTPIDCTVVKTCKRAIPGLMNTRWRVAENTSALAIGYNKDSTSGVAPRNWADVFNLTKFPGKRTFPIFAAGGALEAALLADGVPRKKLFPLDVDRALTKLDTIKSEIIWWSTGTESQQLLGGGEAAMGGLWSPRIYDLVTNLKKPVGIVWNQNISFGSYLVIPKGTKHPAEAMQLVSYIASAEKNARLSYFYALGAATTGALKRVNPKMKPWLASSNVLVSAPQNDIWWNANLAKVSEQFKSWQQS